MKTLEHLLNYEEFRSLLLLVAGLGWLLVAALGLVAILHTLAALGRRSVMYKQPPAREWSKRFYPAELLLIAGVTALALLAQQLAVVPKVVVP